MYLLDTRWQQMHNAMRVREGTVTITGSHPHSRWSLCAQGHRMLSQYQASYPAILDIAIYLSLTKLRIRKIKGLLALPWLHLSSALGAGKAGQARGGERRRDALRDRRLGKLMAKQEGLRAAVCATPSRHAQGARDSMHWRQLRRPNHMRLGAYGPAPWGVGLQRASDGGGFCQSPRLA